MEYFSPPYVSALSDKIHTTEKYVTSHKCPIYVLKNGINIWFFFFFFLPLTLLSCTLSNNLSWIPFNKIPSLLSFFSCHHCFIKIYPPMPFVFLSYCPSTFTNEYIKRNWKLHFCYFILGYWQFQGQNNIPKSK